MLTTIMHKWYILLLIAKFNNYVKNIKNKYSNKKIKPIGSYS